MTASEHPGWVLVRSRSFEDVLETRTGRLLQRLARTLHIRSTTKGDA